MIRRTQKWLLNRRDRIRRLTHAIEGVEDRSRPGVTHLPLKTLKILSFNMQAAIGTLRFHEYLTRSWRHIYPGNKPFELLNEIARLIAPYHIVALQEVDGGSLRSGFVNQLAYLANQGGFHFWHQQVNRNWGQFGQFSNGLLVAFTPHSVENHRLPGLKGRGAMVMFCGDPSNPLVVVAMHLALSRKAQNLQLDYVHRLVDQYTNVVVMGDLNCGSDQLSESHLIKSGLVHASLGHPTYPSWRPAKEIDHIMVSPSIKVVKIDTLKHVLLSDHLPIAIDIELPKDMFDDMHIEE